ncbi:MAG: hypothetical protein MUF71_19390 [Candidatus Kapabacteria bacterium]|jgi:transcriptional antiterminator Rof (Rho-off)|nr:hypothetical protein [Candidatus Kapabacteria bacterium]
MLHYTPINCDFYDVLEELSTLRQNAEIVYLASEEPTFAHGIITNLFAQNGEEFLILTAANEQKICIRLDALCSVNGMNAKIQSGCDVRELSTEITLKKYSTQHGEAEKNTITIQPPNAG